MTNTNHTPSRPSAPTEYSGKWIAWDSPERTKIIASGDSYDDAYDAAQATSVPDPVLQKVPARKRRFIRAAG